jgi:hypothetical protein
MELRRVTAKVLEHGTERVLEFIVVTVRDCKPVERGTAGRMAFSPIKLSPGGILSGLGSQGRSIPQGLLKESI